MRKLIASVILLLFLSIVSFFVIGIIRKNSERVLVENRISSLPSFSFVDLKDNTFNSNSIEEGPVLIVKFHPECDHCRYEISEILNSGIPDGEVKVLLISSADCKTVTRFLSQFDIAGKHSIIPLIDTSFVFSDIFGKDIVPSNYIYDRDLKLVKALYGEYKIETIEKYLGISE